MTITRILFNKSRSPKKLDTFLASTPVAVFLTPIIVAFYDEKIAEWPSWLIVPFCITMGILFFIGLYVLTGKLFAIFFIGAKFLSTGFEKGKEELKNFTNKRKVVKYNRSRRKFISTSAALVSGYAVITTGAAMVNKDEYEIVRKTITFKNLPTKLKGTTITLVSDIHSGPYMSYETMKEYVGVINSLRSDIILIPGDMTSSDKAEINPFIRAFRDLEAQHGIYATLGNHDYLSQPDYISDAVYSDTPIIMMRNDAIEIIKNGEKLCLLGMEDTKESMVEDREVLNGYLDTTISKAKYHFDSYDSTSKILLCHKPYFFRDIASKEMDLVLSGHTHGGQVVLAKYGKFNLSLASTVSEYVSGLYEANGSQMYVSRGIGSSTLPIRLNCPPEITQITLQ